MFDPLLAFWLIILFQARDEVENIHSLNALGYRISGPLSSDPLSAERSDGDPFLVDNFAGRWSPVFLVSPPGCLSDYHVELAQAYRIITEMPDLPDLQVVFVSSDPERDSRQAVKRYVEQFSTDFIGLSGSESGIGTLASQLCRFQ